MQMTVLAAKQKAATLPKSPLAQALRERGTQAAVPALAIPPEF